MRLKKSKKIIIFLAIPFLFVLQFYLFKIGALNPQIKGVEVQVVDGRYIKDIDKYIIKQGEEVVFSPGDYIKFPNYAKEPKVEFKSLDDHNIINIDDNSDEIKNTFLISANKKGLASVALVSNDRILKKFNILVVNPKVTKLTTQVDKSLKYVGDMAEISSTVEVDFDRFNDKYEIDYKSSDESVIKIKNNKLYAVGIGKAKVTAYIQKKKQVFNYDIVARLKNIVADKNISLEVDEKKYISAYVVTSPRNLKTPKIKYRYLENKPPIDRKIRLDDDGKIIGLREGVEKVEISCGSGDNKVNKTVNIRVNEISIENKKIKNLELNYYFDEDDKLILDLKWDYMKGAKKYKIYLKDNTKEAKKYKLIKTLNQDDLKIDKGKISKVIKVNKTKFMSLNYDLYIVGSNNRQISRKSELYSIKYEPEEQESEDLEEIN